LPNKGNLHENHVNGHHVWLAGGVCRYARFDGRLGNRLSLMSTLNYVGDGAFDVDLAWRVESKDGYIREADGLIVTQPLKRAK
jgi:hypothetical protein